VPTLRFLLSPQLGAVVAVAITLQVLAVVLEVELAAMGHPLAQVRLVREITAHLILVPITRVAVGVRARRVQV